MPLIFRKQIDENSVVGVWQITEESNFFKKALELNKLPEEKFEFRLLEKLAVMQLLNTLTNGIKHNKIIYNNDGKPLLEDDSFHVSFSHKKTHVAVIISKNNPDVGVDIEKINSLPLKISSKFVSENDNFSKGQFSDEQRCTMIWSAKETLYKVYSKKELDFREHLFVSYEKDNILKGKILKGNYAKDVTMRFEVIEDLLLVYTSN